MYVCMYDCNFMLNIYGIISVVLRGQELVVYSSVIF